MNMTRAILEGIHEVELEITPEFQKKPGSKPTIGEVDELLTGLGWTKDLETATPVTLDALADERPMIETRWQYPGMAGTHIGVLRSPIEAETSRDPIIDGAFYWRADWGHSMIATYLDAIEKVAKSLVYTYGSVGPMGEKPSQATELDQAMGAVGWGIVASSADVLVYEHAGVDETIEVMVDDEENIGAAAVNYPDRGRVILTPKIDNIVAKAKALESWSH